MKQEEKQGENVISSKTKYKSREKTETRDWKKEEKGEWKQIGRKSVVKKKSENRGERHKEKKIIKIRRVNTIIETISKNNKRHGKYAS